MSARWQLAATPDAVASGVEALTRMLCAAGVGPDQVLRTGVVAAEVLNNAVEHLPQATTHDPLRMACRLSRGDMLLRICGPGIGHPLALHAALPPADAHRGRGLGLIAALCREQRLYLRGDHRAILLRMARS